MYEIDLYPTFEEYVSPAEVAAQLEAERERDARFDAEVAAYEAALATDPAEISRHERACEYAAETQDDRLRAERAAADCG